MADGPWYAVERSHPSLETLLSSARLYRSPDTPGDVAPANSAADALPPVQSVLLSCPPHIPPQRTDAIGAPHTETRCILFHLETGTQEERRAWQFLTGSTACLSRIKRVGPSQRRPTTYCPAQDKTDGQVGRTQGGGWTRPGRGRRKGTKPS